MYSCIQCVGHVCAFTKYLIQDHDPRWSSRNNTTIINQYHDDHKSTTIIVNYLRGLPWYSWFISGSRLNILICHLLGNIVDKSNLGKSTSSHKILIEKPMFTCQIQIQVKKKTSPHLSGLFPKCWAASSLLNIRIFHLWSRWLITIIIFCLFIFYFLIFLSSTFITIIDDHLAGFDC